MKDNMYDESGILKPEYALDEHQKDVVFLNYDLDIDDIRTDFGKGIVYKSIDGGEHASLEAVEQANKAYWDGRMIDKSHKDYVRYIELERAYFDCITPSFNISDRTTAQQVYTTQQEKIVSYIKERYGNYLSEVLAQYGYCQQDSNKGAKR